MNVLLDSPGRDIVRTRAQFNRLDFLFVEWTIDSLLGYGRIARRLSRIEERMMDWRPAWFASHGRRQFGDSLGLLTTAILPLKEIPFDGRLSSLLLLPWPEPMTLFSFGG